MSTVKLQIPIDKKVRDALTARAKSLGFDSLQAYIRVWAKAETEGRQLNFDQGITLSPKANTRYEKMVDELESEKADGKITTFTDTESFMKGL